MGWPERPAIPRRRPDHSFQSSNQYQLAFGRTCGPVVASADEARMQMQVSIPPRNGEGDRVAVGGVRIRS